MKFLFTQHWTGVLNPLGKLSMESTKKYAEWCGAEYRFLEGNVFNENLCPYLQKMFVLDESFDEYDIVVMTDMDMFPRKGLKENIFTDPKGCGVCDEGNRKNAFRMLRKRYPLYSSDTHPFWGGSVYRFPRDIRIQLRSQFDRMNKEEWNWFNKFMQDEAVMHRCAMLANLPMKDMVLPDHWSMGHFREGLETAGFIHIRGGKRDSNGARKGKREKINNYEDVEKRGLIW